MKVISEQRGFRVTVPPIPIIAMDKMKEILGQTSFF